jgi:hypothetical protein
MNRAGRLPGVILEELDHLDDVGFDCDWPQAVRLTRRSSNSSNHSNQLPEEDLAGCLQAIRITGARAACLYTNRGT